MQIHIEGLPGVGKTELAKRLHKEFGIETLKLETIEVDAIRKLQSDDKRRYLFETQLAFLTSKLKQYKDAIRVDKDAVFDYEVYLKTLTFSNHFLDKVQQNILSSLLEHISYSLSNESVFIFLHADRSRILDRIKLRGREYESNYDLNFLESLEKYYFQNMKKTVNNWKIIDYNDFEMGFYKINKILESLR